MNRGESVRTTSNLVPTGKVIGSIAPGKAADIVVLGANPAEKIENVEKVELVFKDGIGYDPSALIQSVRGLVGLR